MRVALVHDWLTGMRGGEKCLEVFCELFPHADLYTLVYLPQRISPTITRMEIHCSWINRLPAIAQAYRCYLPLFPHAVESFDFSRYDLILSSSHCVAKGIFPHRALHVAYIHAPLRYVWDQYDAYFRTGHWWTRAGMALCRRYLQRWDVRSANRVDQFIANSKNIAEKIGRLYQRDAAIIYPPVELDRFRSAASPADYYLVVSALVPYKRIELAIQACTELRVPLKIVGDGPLRRKLERAADLRVEFLGWVADEKLARLYASCRALLFPGEEDFGIVALEAQASGRPVIAYGRGGALESVKGFDATAPNTCPTGVFFQEPTAASLIDAVTLFEKHFEAFNPDAMHAHVEQFSRAKFKEKVADFINNKMRHRGGVESLC